jgi:hypothetical protein
MLKMKKPFHLFLIPAYFVLALLALNIEQVKPSAAYRSLVFTLLAAGLLWCFVRLLVRDWDKAALITSFYLLLFFTYGHIYHLLEPVSILGVAVGRHRLLIPLWVLMAILLTWVLLTKLKKTSTIHGYLNILGIAALAFPLIQLATFTIRVESHRNSTLQNQSSTSALQLSTDQSPPDIYYIILDGYAREDALQKLIDFDNSEFLEKLRRIGFYVADCSQSNYSQTSLSMASSLNYNYMDALGEEFKGTTDDTSGVIQLLSQSAVRHELEDLGYSFVTFETSYYWLRIPDSDYYFSPEKSATQAGEKLLPVNAFEAMLLRESAAVIIIDSATLLSIMRMVDLDYPNKEHRELILYTFDKLREIPLEIPSPKFIYAHIVSPHFPIVFDRTGEPISIAKDVPDDIYNSAAADQIRYLNERILSLVENIIDVSSTPPIIILQADHGQDKAGPEDRLAILNAYYLPNNGNNHLYPSITPVNTFRLIFNDYFGGQFQLLEDQSYYSKYGTPYIYTPILNQCSLSNR